MRSSAIQGMEANFKDFPSKSSIWVFRMDALYTVCRETVWLFPLQVQPNSWNNYIRDTKALPNEMISQKLLSVAQYHWFNEEVEAN